MSTTDLNIIEAHKKIIEAGYFINYSDSKKCWLVSKSEDESFKPFNVGSFSKFEIERAYSEALWEIERIEVNKGPMKKFKVSVQRTYELEVTLPEKCQIEGVNNYFGDVQSLADVAKKIGEQCIISHLITWIEGIGGIKEGDFKLEGKKVDKIDPDSEDNYIWPELKVVSVEPIIK